MPRSRRRLGHTSAGSVRTREVGVGLGRDVGEGAEGVGAEHEVVLHEEEVARQALGPPQQLHDRPRLPPHLRTAPGPSVLAGYPHCGRA